MARCVVEDLGTFSPLRVAPYKGSWLSSYAVHPLLSAFRHPGPIQLKKTASAPVVFSPGVAPLHSSRSMRLSSPHRRSEPLEPAILLDVSCLAHRKGRILVSPIRSLPTVRGWIWEEVRSSSLARHGRNQRCFQAVRAGSRQRLLSTCLSTKAEAVPAGSPQYQSCRLGQPAAAFEHQSCFQAMRAGSLHSLQRSLSNRAASKRCGLAACRRCGLAARNSL